VLSVLALLVTIVVVLTFNVARSRVRMPHGVVVRGLLGNAREKGRGDQCENRYENAHRFS